MSGNELKREFGDYQTPLEFSDIVCDYLKNYLKINPDVIVEPTAGIGNFINSSLRIFSNLKKAYGIEINLEYCDICRENNRDDRVEIINDNFFTYDTKALVKRNNLLVIGNPPWATNSDLNFNLPKKMNFKGLSGTDAITGASNFDICEYMILKLIEEFSNTNTMIAMLCKTSVARNILMELNRNETNTEYVKMIEFNANKVFGISAAACLFIIQLSSSKKNYAVCEVMDIVNPDIVKDIIRCKDGFLTSGLIEVENFEGECELVWRQGVKHDCSKIMELTKKTDGTYINGNKELIELENTFVFPLMKSSFFKSPVIKDNFKKYVIVTQKKARQETKYIETQAIKTWDYLNSNKELFDNRKSSIYNGAPAFSMFGVGDYSYAPYKVGVSGFYKKALFCLVYNDGDIEHPVMGDDTSYFLAFNDKDTAYACMLLLNCKRVQDFLFSISFQDAKRPYTKKVLARISLRKCADVISIGELKEIEKELKLDSIITDDMYNKLKSYISIYQINLNNE